MKIEAIFSQIKIQIKIYTNYIKLNFKTYNYAKKYKLLSLNLE